MRTVYLDTSAFLALVVARDRDHARVLSHIRRLRAERARLLTSDPVLAETVTRLRYDEGLPTVLRFRDLLARAVDRGLDVRKSSPELRSGALDVLARHDGLRLSYTDAVGAVIALQMRVDAVCSLDADFTVLGFAVEPAG